MTLNIDKLIECTPFIALALGIIGIIFFNV